MRRLIRIEIRPGPVKFRRPEQRANVKKASDDPEITDSRVRDLARSASSRHCGRGRSMIHMAPARVTRAAPIVSGKKVRNQMKRTLCSIFILLSTAAFAAASNSTLPDGTEFPSWEKPLHFSKTYYVDGKRRTPTTKGRAQRSSIPHHQSCGAGTSARRACRHRRRRLSRGYPPCARRNQPRCHDQLRGGAWRETSW